MSVLLNLMKKYVNYSGYERYYELYLYKTIVSSFKLCVKSPKFSCNFISMIGILQLAPQFEVFVHYNAHINEKKTYGLLYIDNCFVKLGNQLVVYHIFQN